MVDLSTIQNEMNKTPEELKKERKEKTNNNKLCKKLCAKTTKAISDFNMIEPGDKVMVCVSGGKDSLSLLDILMRLQTRAPFDFELIAVNLNQKQPGFPEHVLPEYFASIGVPFHIETQDTYSIVKKVIPEGKTMCSLCSRLRRGILYNVANKLGATKIALGHHRDDMLETLFLNMFFGAKLKSMPPKLVSDAGEHVVIRPLAYVEEKALVRYAKLQEFPIIPCSLCGSQENLQRQQIKKMIQDWEKEHPSRVHNMFKALCNVVPSHLLDRSLYPFESIRATGVADPQGDIAFDRETFETIPDEWDEDVDEFKDTIAMQLPVQQNISVEQIKRKQD